MTYEDPKSFDKHYSVSISPFLSGDSDSIVAITVDSDMPNQGPNVTSKNGFRLKARSTITGNVYFNFDSGVDSTGYELAAGASELVQVQNLNELWFYSDTAGNQIVALKV